MYLYIISFKRKKYSEKCEKYGEGCEITAGYIKRQRERRDYIYISIYVKLIARSNLMLRGKYLGD